MAEQGAQPILVHTGEVREVWVDGELVARIERSAASRRSTWVAFSPAGDRLCSGTDIGAVARRAAAKAKE